MRRPGSQTKVGFWESGERLSDFDYPVGVGAVAISASGEFGALTTLDNKVHLVRDATELFSYDLSITFHPGVRVSSEGDLLVSGQLPSLDGQVWLFDRNGDLLWDVRIEQESDGWRPTIGFVPDPDVFYIRNKRSVRLLRIVNRDPNCCDGL